MGAFEYAALDEDGRERKGVLEGDAPRQVRQQLRDKGWTPLEVHAVREREGRRAHRPGTVRRLSSADLALVTRQLATLVRSGIPVEEALRVSAQQSGRARLEALLTAVRARILEGHALADALGEFPQIFSEMYRATVAAGEQSGHLDVVLERLADYAESQQQIGQKVMLALIYPVILTLVALLAVMFLTAYVVPQVVEVFQGMGQDLPALTVVVIWISDFLRASWWIVLGLIAAGVITFRFMLRAFAFRRRVHLFLLRLPLVGRLLKGVNTARFARTFSTLLASGVPVLDAMNIAAQVMSNIPMREAVEQGARRVREGASLQAALETGGYFPAMMLHLVASGEASGRLEEMLVRSAETQERELETLRGALLGIFEPMLILVMGALVLVIILAILMPILDLNRLVK